MTTSEDENLLEHCAMTMHVTCAAMSLDKLEPGSTSENPASVVGGAA